ncbi:MAG TPA: hypothetical protein VGI39_22865 [Polyangiaceae bacterium]|jgi:hypothetical protein
MESPFLKTLVAAGVVSALTLGCSDHSVEYFVGDNVKILVARDAEGALQLVEVTVRPNDDECRRAKLDLALKGGSPLAFHAKRQEACRI